MSKTNQAERAVEAITIAAPKRDTAPVSLTADELRGHGVMHCPNPKMPLWSNHPRVFIDLSHGEAAACPYCGTTYRLAQ